MTDPITALDIVSREVPDSMLPPARDDKEHRFHTMEKVTGNFTTMTERMNMISRTMAAMLPKVVSEAPLGAVVDLVAEISKEYDVLDKALADIKKQIDFVKEVSMPERFDADKVKTFNTDRFRVTRTTRLFASILPGKKDEAFEWLEQNDYGSLIKPTVNASSLSAAAKELIEGGHELPDDMFRCHPKNGVSITLLKAARG